MAVAVALVLLVLVAPGFFGVVRDAPIAQLVAFRLASGLAAVGVAIALTVLAVLVAPVRRLALALAAMVVAFALVVTGIQAFRGLDSAPLRPHRLGDVRLASWNILHDAVPAGTIVDLAVGEEVDALALLEVSPGRAQEVADGLAAAGRPMTVHLTSGTGQDDATALLLSASLGGYSVDAETAPTSVLPSLVARPDTSERPVLAAVHAMAPIPEAMPEWRNDLGRIAALCTAEDDVVVLGDLNSTLDHWSALPGAGDLGGCIDSGASARGAGLGSWPTSLPPLLGAPIDHVLFSGPWEVSGYRVLDEYDGAGSDHRPLLVQLSVRGMAKEAS